MAKIEHCSGLNANGLEVEGLLGVQHNGFMIVDPYMSECGRFAVHPSAYGLTEEEAEKIVAHNQPLLAASEASDREDGPARRQTP